MSYSPMFLTREERVRRFGFDCADALEWKGWYDETALAQVTLDLKYA